MSTSLLKFSHFNKNLIVGPRSPLSSAAKHFCVQLQLLTVNRVTCVMNDFPAQVCWQKEELTTNGYSYIIAAWQKTLHLLIINF